MCRWVYTLTSKGLSIYQLAILRRIRKRGSINIVEVCNLVLTVRGLREDPSFKPSILSQISSLEELGTDAQGMYRMMRSLEKRGLVARLLHRRPAVWYDFSWHDGMPKLEQREDGWYDYNYVMDRDGQVMFQIKDKRWIVRGVKMSRAQIKRHIEQQISEMKRRQQAN
ncbi:MAG: hypothetical protein M3299_01575 [Thermoproteota archaeon]|nr:hypothetical protein [Thermoproteota archaeon]